MPLSASGEMAYHTVKGEKVHGLIVDPGASEGLLGVDTLLEYQQEVLQDTPFADKVTFAPSPQTFTGIDGETSPSLARVTIPLGIEGLPDATFSGDLIGDHGSRCPALLPLPPMRRYKMGVLCGFFEN